MKLYSLLLCASAACWFGMQDINAQITERPRPVEWDHLVEGARFIDRFLPMPAGKLSSDVWGAKRSFHVMSITASKTMFVPIGEEISYWEKITNIIYTFAAGRRTLRKDICSGPIRQFTMPYVKIR